MADLASFVVKTLNTNCSASYLVESLCKLFESAEDKSNYGGKAIQCVYSLHNQLSKKEKLFSFDVNSLPAFAESSLVASLRENSVLVLSERLSKKIDFEKQIFRNGEKDEVELRAASVHACEQISNLCRQNGKNFSPASISHFLISKFDESGSKNVCRHKTKGTKFY